MDIQEFSDGFDIMFSASIADPAVYCDEYEKSLFLTKAQELMVESIYPTFELDERSRRLLSNLVKTKRLSISRDIEGGNLTDKSYKVILPSDIYYIVYESAKVSSDDECMDGLELDVIPVLTDFLLKVLKNPFKRPNRRKVLRLDINHGLTELISENKITLYILRYIAKPSPIVLTHLDEPLSIQGVTIPTECKLDSSLHHKILEMAVQMAVLVKVPKKES